MSGRVVLAPVIPEETESWLAMQGAKGCDHNLGVTQGSHEWRG